MALYRVVFFKQVTSFYEFRNVEAPDPNTAGNLIREQCKEFTNARARNKPQGSTELSDLEDVVWEIQTAENE